MSNRTTASRKSFSPRCLCGRSRTRPSPACSLQSSSSNQVVNLKETDMASSSPAVTSHNLEDASLPFVASLRSFPALLLLAAIGFAGKFIEQSIAAYTKVSPPHVPQYRIRSLGNRDWPGYLQHRRNSARLRTRCGNLRVLAESRNRSAGLALPARRSTPSRRHLHLARRHRDHPLAYFHAYSRPRLQTQSQAHFASRGRLLDLRSLRHHCRQACHRRRR